MGEAVQRRRGVRRGSIPRGSPPTAMPARLAVLPRPTSCSSLFLRCMTPTTAVLVTSASWASGARTVRSRRSAGWTADRGATPRAASLRKGGGRV